MKVQPQTGIRWTSEEARKFYVQLIEKIEAYNAEIGPKVAALMARGRTSEAAKLNAAKLNDDHAWAMQPLVNQAGRLHSEFTVPFIVVSTETAPVISDTREAKE